MRASPEIRDCAVIGNTRSAAIVTADGTIPWLCWPRFDSPALLGGLLDPSAGHWTMQPAEPFTTTRRYLPDTNVLETTFTTAHGRLVLVDCMPVSDETTDDRLQPEEELVRIATCVGGEVPLDIVFEPRPGFGTARYRMRRSPQGLRLELRGALVELRAECVLVPTIHGAHGRAHLYPGQSVAVSLSWSNEAPAVLRRLGDEVRSDVERTVRFWRGWAARCVYDGPWRSEVLRSALTLKLLTHAVTGAIVAAPTTSLPEQPGGPLNWDYRYCWLRDAALVSRALLGLGYVEEAGSFADWILHATRLTAPELEVLYDVYGRRPPSERELTHLTGYRGARPVRVGNAAARQLQLDVYGEVIDAVARLGLKDLGYAADTRRLLVGFGEVVCENWNKPDESIWEVRGGAAHHTFSRALCWVALDRLLAMHRSRCLPYVPVEHFAETRSRITAEIEARGFNEELGAYTSHLDGSSLDAAMLLLPLYRYIPADHPRMRSTWRAIRDRLSAGNGLLYRYEYRNEGAFGICGFWAAEYLARGGGTLDESEEWFESLLPHANDVGLFAEETDPDTGGALGNFPQAFTHVGLVNAALTIHRRIRTLRYGSVRRFEAPRHTLALEAAP